MTGQSGRAIRAIDLIFRKRSGGELSDDEINFFIEAVVSNGAAHDLAADRPVPSTPAITDAQLGALLMAIYTHHLSARELATLTAAMRSSGEVLDRTSINTVLVDKHSTGGVGDKTSLLIAPILAAAGLANPTPAGLPGVCVPMISGRSLGHTGGTLDKLETIPGFNTQLPLDRVASILRTTGAVLIGQTPGLVPADRLLYAMRDHTGTVESPFLITASIMSKKLAESLDALVLDVKVGSGAFLPSYAQSRLLADLMVEAGEAAGTRTVALLTSMDQPLGRFAGNWLEVAECVEILQLADRSPHPLSSQNRSQDLIELSLTLAGHMLHLAGLVQTPTWGYVLAEDLLRSGRAYQAWLGIVRAQGGAISIFLDPFTHHRPAHTTTLTAPRAGFLASMDCTAVGWAVQRLGAGREHPGDPVSAHAGIKMHAKLGDALQTGDPLVTLFADTPQQLEQGADMIAGALTLADAAPVLQPLIHEIISASAPRK